MKIIIIVSVLIGISCGKTVPFKSCSGTSASGKLSEVSVDPCPTYPCQFKKGMNYTLKATFTPSAASGNKIKSVIHGIIAGVPVPFPFAHSDVCKDAGCGLTCPLVKDKQYLYTATLPVLESYPSIELYVEWEFEDTDAKQDIWCFKIAVAIVKGDVALPRSVKDQRKIHF